MVKGEANKLKLKTVARRGRYDHGVRATKQILTTWEIQIDLKIVAKVFLNRSFGNEMENLLTPWICNWFLATFAVCLSALQAASSVVFTLLSVLPTIARLSLAWWLMTFSYVCQGWSSCCPSASLHWVSSEMLKVSSPFVLRITPQSLDSMYMGRYDSKHFHHCDPVTQRGTYLTPANRKIPLVPALHQ